MKEFVSTQVPVKVEVILSDDVFIQAFRRSRLYWQTIKPRLDLAQFLEKFMKDPEEFYRWFYTVNIEEIPLETVFAKITEKNKIKTEGEK